jgi:chemotaxis protein CheX
MTQSSGQDILAAVLERNSSLFATTNFGQTPQDITSNVLHCLETSALRVFNTMCGIELKLEKRFKGCFAARQYDASGIITFSGTLQATVALRFQKDLAFACAGALLGMQPKTLDEDVVDVVGEMANMVAGGAKDHILSSGLLLGLPVVVTGLGHKVSLPADMKVSTLHFQSCNGEFVIEIGIKPTATIEVE